jgi:hypothetical protein
MVSKKNELFIGPNHYVLFEFHFMAQQLTVVLDMEGSQVCTPNPPSRILQLYSGMYMGSKQSKY